MMCYILPLPYILFETYLDETDIRKGSIPQNLQKALKECKFMLFFNSKNSLESNYVQTEGQSFFHSRKTIPVKLDDLDKLNS